MPGGSRRRGGLGSVVGDVRWLHRVALKEDHAPLPVVISGAQRYCSHRSAVLQGVVELWASMTRCFTGRPRRATGDRREFATVGAPSGRRCTLWPGIGGPRHTPLRVPRRRRPGPVPLPRRPPWSLIALLLAKRPRGVLLPLAPAAGRLAAHVALGDARRPERHLAASVA